MTMENINEIFKEEDSFQEHHADLKWPDANRHCSDSPGSVSDMAKIINKHLCRHLGLIPPDWDSGAILGDNSYRVNVMKAANEIYSQNLEDRHD